MYQLTVSIFEKYIKISFDLNIDNIKDAKTKINELFMNNKASGKVEYRDVTQSNHLDDIGLYAIELYQILPNHQSFLIGRGSDPKKINAEQKAAINALFLIKNKGLLIYNMMSRQSYFIKPHSLENEPILSNQPQFASVLFRRIFNDQYLSLQLQKLVGDQKMIELRNIMSFDLSDQKMIEWINIDKSDMSNKSDINSFLQSIQ